jgi:hypothetical protein
MGQAVPVAEGSQVGEAEATAVGFSLMEGVDMMELMVPMAVFLGKSGVKEVMRVGRAGIGRVVRMGEAKSCSFVVRVSGGNSRDKGSLER